MVSEHLSTAERQHATSKIWEIGAEPRKSHHHDNDAVGPVVTLPFGKICVATYVATSRKHGRGPNRTFEFYGRGLNSTQSDIGLRAARGGLLCLYVSGTAGPGRTCSGMLGILGLSKVWLVMMTANWGIADFPGS